MDVILQALADGAKTIANDAATDALKSIYSQLKSLIQERWIGNPNPDVVLSEFGKNPEQWRDLLEDKLQQSGISGDETVRQQARLVIEECSNTRVQNRKGSNGDTVTDRAMTLKNAKFRNEGDVFSAIGNNTKTVVHNNPVLFGGIIVVLAAAICYLADVSTKAGSLIFWTSPPASSAQPGSPTNPTEVRPSAQLQPSDKNNSGAQRSSSPAVQSQAANLTSQQCSTIQQRSTIQQQQLENSQPGQLANASPNPQQCPAPTVD